MQPAVVSIQYNRTLFQFDTAKNCTGLKCGGWRRSIQVPQDHAWRAPRNGATQLLLKSAVFTSYCGNVWQTVAQLLHSCTFAGGAWGCLCIVLSGLQNFSEKYRPPRGQRSSPPKSGLKSCPAFKFTGGVSFDRKNRTFRQELDTVGDAAA